MTYESLPLVSIVINNYNYASFVTQAIESAFAQTYSNIEVIVVDDGSTDRSWSIINSYADKLIAITKENGGQSSAINAGFAASKGEIICLLDSDDIFLPEKVAEVVKSFTDLDIGWCFHPLRYTKYIDQSAEEFIANYPLPPADKPLSKIDFRSEIIQQAKHPNWGPATSALCFRRLLLERILPMPEVIRTGSDNYLRYAAVFLSLGCFINKPLSSLRIHGSNNYSLRSDKVHQKAQVLIHTGYHLRLKYPELKHFANKLFSRAIGQKWLVGANKVGNEKIIEEYFANTNRQETLIIYLRAMYRYGNAIKQRELTKVKKFIIGFLPSK